MVFKTKINCPICSGKAVLSKTNLDFFNGFISLKDNPIYECEKCKEQFATGKIVDKALRNAKSGFNFSRQIISTGGSLAITLPSDLSEYYSLEKGSKIQIIPQSKNEIRIITKN